MKFGMFSAVACPKPWTAGKEAKAYKDEVELAVVAEEAGVDYFWAPEHHFLEEYSHCSASETLLLAIGMRTTRIRLVTGIVNICPPINHPIRVAERIAIIDILTDGRIELGTGRGSGSLEVNGFGVTNDISRDMWEEAIAAIPQMWMSESFSWDGKYFKIPERNILPKPVQSPHPPLWVTASNPATAEVAARKGIGLAMFSFADPAKAESVIKAYKAGIKSCEPVGGVINDQVMVITSTLCMEDGDEARAIYQSSMFDQAPYFKTYFDTVFPRTDVGPGPFDQTQYRAWVEEEKRSNLAEAFSGFGVKDTVSREDLIARGTCIGDPHDLIEAIKSFESVGVDQIVFVPKVGLQRTLEEMTDSTRLIGKHVLPAFREPTPSPQTV